MANIAVDKIYKSFDGQKIILKKVCFSVQDGEFVSLLGPSGCGKTTLLRIVAGLETTDSGTISIGGREVSRLSPKDRDIAMVFQSYALYPHLNVQKNIGMGLKLRGIPAQEIRRRVQDTADTLGLSEFLGRMPSALSGGQRQRVALARALVRQPSAYLLDEPLSNLDAVLRDKTRSELKLLFKRVRGTVLYVTHDQVEAMTLSDRIVVLHHGEIQQVGTPEEIYRQPANVFVAGFLGSPAMNIFPAEIPGATCGIRPEHIELARQPGQEGWKQARVVLAEPTGASTIVSLEIDGLCLRATVPGSWKPEQETIYAHFPESALHFFNKETGLRLSRSNS